MKTKQKGFAIIESLLILVIIAVIGGIGWYAYSSKNKTDKILSQADKISQNTPVVKNSIPSNGNSVTVKEWNIKISFADADKVTYTAPEKSPGDYGLSDKAEFIGLNLKPEVTSIADCQDLGLGVYRDVRSSSTAGTFKNAPTVNGYFYVITGGPGACNDNSPKEPSPINLLRSKIDSDELGHAQIRALN